MDPQSIYNFLNTGGLLAFLILAGFLLTVGSFRKWWVPGWLYEEARTDGEKWEKLAKDQQDRLDKLLSLHEVMSEKLRGLESGHAEFQRQIGEVRNILGRMETQMMRVEASQDRRPGNR